MSTTRTSAGVMHEWPLVVFTALAIPAAGLLLVRPFLDALDVGSAASATPLTATALLAVALLVSLAHLGRPLRAPHALRRAGRSALASEVLFAAVMLALSTLERFSEPTPAVRSALVLCTSACSAIFLGVIGLVYFLPARRPWRSALVASPLLLGLAGGLLWHTAAPPAIVVLLLEAIVAGPAWARHAGEARRCLPVHARIFARRRLLIALRFIAANLLPAMSLLAGLPLVAAVVFVGGIFVDRFAFCGTACARTTEAEMADIEAIIVGQATPPPAPWRPGSDAA